MAGVTAHKDHAQSDQAADPSLRDIAEDEDASESFTTSETQETESPEHIFRYIEIDQTDVGVSVGFPPIS